MNSIKKNLIETKSNYLLNKKLLLLTFAPILNHPRKKTIKIDMLKSKFNRNYLKDHDLFFEFTILNLQENKNRKFI